MRIARQGFPYIVVLLLLALAAYAFPPTRLLAIPAVALAGFVTFFFRDPTRRPPQDPHLLVSPGDGKIVSVGPVPGDGAKKQVAMFLSIFDVHINRSPLAATVGAIRYTPGRFVAAYREDAGSENERNQLELSDGDYVVIVRQIAGVVARRIVCWVKEGARLERGDRFGLIQFGSRMEVVVSADTEILVKVGDRVRGGETPIARRP